MLARLLLALVAPRGRSDDRRPDWPGRPSPPLTHAVAFFLLFLIPNHLPLSASALTLSFITNVRTRRPHVQGGRRVSLGHSSAPACPRADNLGPTCCRSRPPAAVQPHLVQGPRRASGRAPREHRARLWQPDRLARHRRHRRSVWPWARLPAKADHRVRASSRRVPTDLPAEFPALRERLLRLANTFASLPEDVREKYADP
jgi:hypothetical protein